MAVTALTIHFKDAEGSSALAAELDGERNQGRESFSPGDTVYFRVYARVGYGVSASAGGVARVASSVEYAFVETVQFAGEAEASLSRPVTRVLPATTWLGTAHGAISTDEGAVRAPSIGPKDVGVASVAYTALADIWQVVTPATADPGGALAVLIYPE